MHTCSDHLRLYCGAPVHKPQILSSFSLMWEFRPRSENTSVLPNTWGYPCSCYQDWPGRICAFNTRHDWNEELLKAICLWRRHLFRFASCLLFFACKMTSYIPRSCPCLLVVSCLPRSGDSATYGTLAPSFRYWASKDYSGSVLLIQSCRLDSWISITFLWCLVHAL